MKRFNLLVLAVFAALTVSAQAIPDGYYRAQNTATKRWAVLCDDKAYVDKSVGGASAVDLRAIHTYMGFERVAWEPGSVIKFVWVASGNGYTLSAQGTDTHEMLKKHGDYYLNLIKNGRAYIASAYAEGFNIHLSDLKLLNDAPVDSMGFMQPSGQSTQYWFIKAVDASSDNYFGFKPTLTLGEKHYLPFYASFGFTKYSDGVKAYYVNNVDEGLGIAEMKEITSSTFPAGTPMIIETANAEPADNRVNVVDGSAAPKGNKLTGVYFCSADILLPKWYQSGSKRHDVYTLNDPATMRLLAVDNGELVLKKVPTSEVKYLPANSFYLKVSKTCPDVLRLVSSDEYTTGIRNVKTPTTKVSDKNVFNLNGQRVSTTGLSNLPAGIYIQGGKKVVVK